MAWIYYYLGDFCCRVHLWGLYQWFMRKSWESDTDGTVWTDVDEAPRDTAGAQEE